MLITNNRCSIALSSQCENLVRVCCELVPFWYNCVRWWSSQSIRITVSNHLQRRVRSLV